MTLRFFSDRNRPVHLGPYPLERLKRQSTPELEGLPAPEPLRFERPDAPESIVNAMADYQAMMDAIRDGLVNKVVADCPDDPTERANHIKAFGYFADAAMVGTCLLPRDAALNTPWRNPGIDALAHDLKTKQTKTLASGIDQIMAGLKDAMEAPPSTIDEHTHSVVFLYEMPRDPAPGEAGCDWLSDAQTHRAALRATETAVVLANYLRLLGYDAKAHSATSSDVDLNRLTIEAGLAIPEGGRLVNPYLGDRFGIAALTTTFEITPDQPLARHQPLFGTKGPAWWSG